MDIQIAVSHKHPSKTSIGSLQHMPRTLNRDPRLHWLNTDSSPVYTASLHQCQSQDYRPVHLCPATPKAAVMVHLSMCQEEIVDEVYTYGQAMYMATSDKVRPPVLFTMTTVSPLWASAATPLDHRFHGRHVRYGSSSATTTLGPIFAQNVRVRVQAKLCRNKKRSFELDFRVS